MPESNDGAPRFGTVVVEAEVIHFSQLPAGLKIYLDGRNRVMVRFLSCGRVLPFDDPLVQDYLYMLLAKGKRRPPTKTEFDMYTRRCRASALGDVPTGPNAAEAMLWNEPVVMAVMKLMYRVYHEEHKAQFVANLTTVREKLVTICDKQGWDCTDWPKANWFRGYLEDRADLLAEYNIRLGFEVTGDRRKVVLEYIDVEKIPRWVPPVTR